MDSSTPSNRYVGKPLLKILDSYVLWAIGELSGENIARLKQMETNLIDTLGEKNKTKTWQEAVEHNFELTPEFRLTVMDYWMKNQEIARKNNLQLTPMDFAMMFVDSNFREW